MRFLEEIKAFKRELAVEENMLIFCCQCGKENPDTSDFCSRCKSILFGGFIPEGKVLKERYKVISLVKSGGMGAVYKASDIKFDRFCAIKELLPPFGDREEQEQVFEWFCREAEILSNLSHPNLPGVVDFFMRGVRYYMVMDFVDGRDLDSILMREGSPGLPEKKVVPWAKQILSVLSYLHSREPSIIYRDLKPSNIMLRNDGQIILIDFGVARTIHKKSKTQTIIGTSGYTPLEQLQGKAEFRSDIYALGVTIHHLLTGIMPEAFTFRFKTLKRDSSLYIRRAGKGCYEGCRD